MVSVQDALDIILQSVRPLAPEKVCILDALGRVMAETVHAPRDLPPRDNSAMDGYAFRFVDLRPEEPHLRLAGTVAAGDEPTALAAGEAMKIMTGAPVPHGADTVVPVEDTEPHATHVRVRVVPQIGANIRPAGEDVRAGDRVVEAGTLARPAEIGMLASLGRSFVCVHQRPRVAVLATGDEIVDVDEWSKGGRIVNSNSYGVAAQVKEAGGVPVVLGIGRDEPRALANMLARAATADVVVTTGGVSMGDYDYVRPVLEEMGIDVRFWQVAMKPGKPFVFGTRGPVPVFGLPGNPVSTMVAFEQFVRPALRRLQGHVRLHRPVLEAILDPIAGPVRVKKGRCDFVRCRVEKRPDGFRVTSVKKQGSGILKTLVEANGLLVFAPDSTGAEPGEAVRVQIYDAEFLEDLEFSLPGRQASA